jgi:F-box and leucine-rich repeat protein GRR1
MSQRATFCVYSGKGVSELRAHLAELYNGRSEELNPTGDSTEYDEEDGYVGEEAGDVDGEAGLEWDDDEDYSHRPNQPMPPQYTPQNRPSFRGRRHTVTASSGVGSRPAMQEVPVSRDQQTFTVTAPTPEHAPNLLSTTTIRTNGHTEPSHVTLQRQPRGVGFGQQPLVESSSPTPSDVASNRSTGTNQSNGAGFFRTYQYAAAPSSTRGNGTLTPDLEFAEIGHGRGVGHRSADSVNAGTGSTVYSSATHLAPPMPNGQRSSGRTEMSANPPPSSSHRFVPWPRVYREETTPSPPHSPARSSNDSDGAQREGEVSVKRGLMRAGDFATSLIFGRSSSSSH